MAKKQIKKVSRVSKMFSRFLVLIVVTLSCMIALKSNADLRSKVYKLVYQSNLRFPKINELYEKYFGSSLPLTGDRANAVMVSSLKIEYEKADKYKDGVKLTVKDNYVIPLINSGIVVFAGQKDGYGNTIIVEDAEGVDIWYCNLKDIKVSMYDYLKKESIVGEANGDNFVLVFTKDEEVLDYKKYI